MISSNTYYLKKNKGLIIFLNKMHLVFNKNEKINMNNAFKHFFVCQNIGKNKNKMKYF